MENMHEINMHNVLYESGEKSNKLAMNQFGDMVNITLYSAVLFDLHEYYF